MIEFRTFGTLDLRAADGRELHSLLAQPKRIALLAYLCIAEPRGYHRRDTLLGLFWPDSDQDHARTSLRKSLHILRRALGEEAILSRGDEEVAVDFERISCDVVSFDDLIRANRFQDALELYRGDLLTGFFVDDAPEFEQWLHSERVRLRAVAARAAYDVAEELEKDQDYRGAASFARRSLDLGAGDERSLRQLIGVLWRAGDRAGAIETYEAFARTLAVEYQTQPSAETRSLIEHIRAGNDISTRDVEGKEAVDRENTPGAIAPAVTLPALAAKSKGRTLRRERLLFIAAALAALISSGLLWGLLRPRYSTPVVRFVLVVDSSEAIVPGASYWGRVAISTDGTRLAYIGGPGGELLVRPLNQLHATTISGTKGAETPFFSPDGQRVGFLTEDHVFTAPTSGGPVVTVCDSLAGVAGASWARDGFIYVDGRGYRSLLRVEGKRGAQPKWFTTLDTVAGEIDHTWPDVLPNGKGVLFAVTFLPPNGSRDSLSYAIAVADIPSGKHRFIVNDAMYARYASSGHLLYVTTKKTLMVAPFDQNSMKVTGEPTPLVEGMRLGRFGSADVTVSANGTLVYAIGGSAGRQELVWVTRNGKTEQVDPDWTGDFWHPALSPDGKRLAIVRRLEGQRADVWVKQLDRGASIKLTSDRGFGDIPTWTPDGNSVTFLWNAGGMFGFWTRRADGSIPAVLQVRATRRIYRPVWSPDAKWLVYATDETAPGSGDIVGIRPGIDPLPVPLVASPSREAGPVFSPDGRWLAYISDESGRNQIYAVPFPNTHAAKWAISTGGGIDPQWSHSGRELFYRDSADYLVAVEIMTRPRFSIGRGTRLFSTAGFAMFGGLGRYAVSPDDRRFLMMRLVPGPPEKLVVVQNWFDELSANDRSQYQDR